MAENTRTTAKDAGPHPLDIALGARIREVRKALGMSHGELATKIGISFQQQSKRERGINRVSFSALVLTARALNTTVAVLVGDLW